MKMKQLLLGLCSATLLSGIASSAFAADGGAKIYLYQKNDCRSEDATGRDDVDIIMCSSGPDDGKCTYRKGDYVNNAYGSRFKNDDYRSMFLDNVDICTITVYDEGDCDNDDDVTRIQVSNTTAQCVGTFERSLSGRNWSSQSDLGRKSNGLDGKVSCIRIDCQ